VQAVKKSWEALGRPIEVREANFSLFMLWIWIDLCTNLHVRVCVFVKWEVWI